MSKIQLIKSKITNPSDAQLYQDLVELFGEDIFDLTEWKIMSIVDHYESFFGKDTVFWIEGEGTLLVEEESIDLLKRDIVIIPARLNFNLIVSSETQMRWFFKDDLRNTKSILSYATNLIKQASSFKTCEKIGRFIKLPQFDIFPNEYIKDDGLLYVCFGKQENHVYLSLFPIEKDSIQFKEIDLVFLQQIRFAGRSKELSIIIKLDEKYPFSQTENLFLFKGGEIFFWFGQKDGVHLISAISELFPNLKCLKAQVGDIRSSRLEKIMNFIFKLPPEVYGFKEDINYYVNISLGIPISQSFKDRWRIKNVCYGCESIIIQPEGITFDFDRQSFESNLIKCIITRHAYFMYEEVKYQIKESSGNLELISQEVLNYGD